jgi:hypothetical protein
MDVGRGGVWRRLGGQRGSMIPDGVSALLDEHRSSLLSIAEQIRMEDEVASVLGGATPKGMSERGWADPGQPRPLGWPRETVVRSSVSRCIYR